MADSKNPEEINEKKVKPSVKKKSAGIAKNKDFEEIFDNIDIDEIEDLEKIKKPKKKKKVESPTDGGKKPNINIKDKDHMIDGIGDLDAYIAKSKTKSSSPTMSVKTGANYNFLDQSGVDVRKLDNLYAIVPHGKGEHKLVWFRDSMPDDLWNDDKGREKGSEYIKNGNKIYDVHVDFKRHKELKTSNGERYDVWIIDSAKDLEDQMKAIKSGLGGGKNFGEIEVIKAKSGKLKAKTNIDNSEAKKADDDPKIKSEKLESKSVESNNEDRKIDEAALLIAEAKKKAKAEETTAKAGQGSKKQEARDAELKAKAEEERIKKQEEEARNKKQEARDAELKAAVDEKALKEASDSKKKVKDNEIKIDDIDVSLDEQKSIVPPIIVPEKVTSKKDSNEIDISSITDIDDEDIQVKSKKTPKKSVAEAIKPEEIIVKEAIEEVPDGDIKELSPTDDHVEEDNSKVISSNFFDEIEENKKVKLGSSNGFDRKKLLIKLLGLLMILTVLGLGWLIFKVMFSNTGSDSPQDTGNQEVIVIPGEDADTGNAPEDYDNEIIIPGDQEGNNKPAENFSGDNAGDNQVIEEPDARASEAYIQELIGTLRVLKKDTRTLLNRARLINNPDAYNYSLAAYSRANEILESYDGDPDSVSVEDMESTIDKVRLFVKSVRDLTD